MDAQSVHLKIARLFWNDRSIKGFQSAIQSYNIIVVYGESRQGKTWTIERYCPLQIRIGCNANMTLDQIKLEMLHLVGQDIRKIEHTVTEEYAEGCQASSDIGNEMLVKAGIDASLRWPIKRLLQHHTKLLI